MLRAAAAKLQPCTRTLACPRAGPDREVTQKGGVDRWGEKTQLGDRGERQEASLKNIRMHNLTQTIISIECAVSNFTGRPPFPSPPTTIACNTLSLQADNLDSASRPTRMFPTIAVKFKCTCCPDRILMIISLTRRHALWFIISVLFSFRFSVHRHYCM